MGKIIFTILLLFNVKFLGQKVCIFPLDKENNIEIKKYKYNNALIIYNEGGIDKDSCYSSKEREIHLYMEPKPIKINRKALKKYYTLLDFITFKVSYDCDILAFKLENKYYEKIEVQVDMDMAPPRPKEN